MNIHNDDNEELDVHNCLQWGGRAMKSDYIFYLPAVVWIMPYSGACLLRVSYKGGTTA